METQTFQFPLWVPGIFLLLGFILVPLMILSRMGKLPFIRAFPGVVVLALLWGVAAPSFYQHRVEISPARVQDVKGLWFLPESHEFPFEEIARVKIMIPANDASKQQWLFETPDGSQRLYRPSGLWQKHSAAIEEAFRRNAIPVTTLKAEG